MARRERQRQLEQLAAEQRSGAGDGVRDQERRQVGVVVATPRPVRVGEQPSVAIDDPSVAVDEVGVTEGAQQRLELPGVPAVVLVGERRRTRRSAGSSRARARSCGSSRGGAATARRRSAGRRRGCVASRRTAPGALRVVAHHADPVGVGLRANRLHLSLEEVERRLVGGHADGRPGARGRGRSASRWRPRLVPGRARSAPARPSRSVPSSRLATAPELAAHRLVDRLEGRDRPEPAPIAHQKGILRRSRRRARSARRAEAPAWDAGPRTGRALASRGRSPLPRSPVGPTRSSRIRWRRWKQAPQRTIALPRPTASRDGRAFSSRTSSSASFPWGEPFAFPWQASPRSDAMYGNFSSRRSSATGCRRVRSAGP